MIYDIFENRQQYYPCHKAFPMAFEFIAEAVKRDLAPGKYEIDGSNVFAIVQEYTTKPKGEEFEAHRQYIDIQYIVSGQESMECAELKNCQVVTPYDAQKDCAMHICTGVSAQMEFDAGTFAVFFPRDAHKPGFMLNMPGTVKKIIVKVHV